MVVMEVWAGNRSLAGAVFLIVVPGPGWRGCSLVVRRMKGP